MLGIFALIVLVVGIAIAIGAIFASSYNKSMLLMFGGGVFAFGLILFGFAAFTTVDEGEVVVPIQFGEALDPIQTKGINFKSPFAGVVVMPTRTVEVTFQGAKPDDPELGESEPNSFRQISALSSEGAQIAVDVTALYHIDPTMTEQIYATVGAAWEEVLVLPRVRNVVRDCLPQYTFEQARTSLRGEAQLCMLERLQSTLGPRGIVIEDILLRDMRADEQLQDAIDAKLEAQSNAQRAEFIQREAQVTAETKRIEAEGRAKARIEEATGEAEAIRLQADAEAYANDVIARSLTPELLQLRVYEQLGDKTVVLGDAGGVLPILPLE